MIVSILIVDLKFFNSYVILFMSKYCLKDKGAPFCVCVGREITCERALKCNCFMHIHTAFIFNESQPWAKRAGQEQRVSQPTSVAAEPLRRRAAVSTETKPVIVRHSEPDKCNLRMRLGGVEPHPTDCPRICDSLLYMTCVQCNSSWCEWWEGMCYVPILHLLWNDVESISKWDCPGS